MFTNGEQVVWHQRTDGDLDAYGRPKVSFVDAVLENVAVAPGSTSEPRRQGSERVTTQMTLYLQPDPGVKPGDRFTVRGTRYEVEGDVSGAWVNPFTGNGFGCEIGLRKVTG